ncbi:MAG TPA: MmcQ/YjbR family DNA-binding protein [Candidatus Polarisedimenticolaceae bacterium]|nr:MmcQ/YjbR family DNA-binding protein [Candidatus Polarisedimenticolaceae bacterium]
MATWKDVQRLALRLPETTEERRHEHAAWMVKGKAFAWERPLRKSDLEALGSRAPKGDILGVRVADLTVKEAVLAARSKVCFTTPHFDGYPAVLVQLGKIKARDLEELLIEAWLAKAPKTLARKYLGGRDA